MKTEARGNSEMANCCQSKNRYFEINPTPVLFVVTQHCPPPPPLVGGALRGDGTKSVCVVDYLRIHAASANSKNEINVAAFNGVNTVLV